MIHEEYPVSPLAAELIEGKAVWRQYNGISHAKVTEPAHRRLMAALRSYGNDPSPDHERALYLLLAHMTEAAQGRRPGRVAWPLATGMGKTTAIIHWIAALYESQAGNGVHHVTVAVAASKVEALCDLKKQLMAQGVPESYIGLSHSYRFDASKARQDGFASMPATEDNDKRPVLLLTHQKTKGRSSDLEQFLMYRGRRRNLLVWDESLMVSDSRIMAYRDVKMLAAAAAAGYVEYPKHRDLVQWVVESERLIGQALEEGRDEVIRLPEVTTQQMEAWRHLAATMSFASGPIGTLLEIGTEPLRVTGKGGKGALWYQPALPEGLPNITVLDASYPIRELAKADPYTRDAGKYCHGLSVPLAGIKRYDNVTVRHMKASGGRKSLTDDTVKGFDSKAVNDVVDVIEEIPPDECVLVFVYKDRTNAASARRTLERKLKEREIDLEAQVNGKPRICIATWGQETSSNDWVHCRHVILCGVLEQSTLDLAARLCGQTDNLEVDLGNGVLNALAKGEVFHAVYQAASRGCCRIVEGNQAKAMDLWVITNRNLQEGLSEVMPGASWLPWEGSYGAKPEGKIAILARSILTYLATVKDADQISTQKLKKLSGNEDAHPSTWREGLREAMKGTSDWALINRSVVRKDFASAFDRDPEEEPEGLEDQEGHRETLEGNPAATEGHLEVFDDLEASEGTPADTDDTPEDSAENPQPSAGALRWLGRVFSPAAVIAKR